MIANLAVALSGCAEVIQAKMIEHFTRADAEHGLRVAESLRRGTARLDAAESNSGRSRLLADTPRVGARPGLSAAITANHEEREW